jgi:hypothetical protein
MTDQSDDIKLVRDALLTAEYASSVVLGALDRLEATLLPELTEGWMINSFHFNNHEQNYYCLIDHAFDPDIVGKGQTPRAAALNAIRKIGEKT